MGQVSVVLNGRTYRLECGEGEESHLIALTEYLGTHVEDMKRKFGQVGDDRLILMASLLITDELWELKREMEQLKSALAVARRDRRRPAGTSQRAVRHRVEGAGQGKKAALASILSRDRISFAIVETAGCEVR
jgi:cell division protein ZapA (FtsZ GTPase activity inhibitor)